MKRSYFRIAAASTRIVLQSACAAAVLATGVAHSQALPSGGFAGPPPPMGAPPTVESPPRPGGLKVAPYGFTVGEEGGLEKEFRRNGTLPPPRPLAADAPPPSDDPRDFAGSWFGDQYLAAFEIMRDIYGNDVPFTQRGREVMDGRLIANDRQVPYITPAIMCRPSGPAWDMIRIPFRIFQSKDKLDVFSDSAHAWWQVAINPALALPAGTRSYMGNSTGHWDGNTLVVNTTDFKTRQWLSFRGTPVSPAGKLTQRIRKVHEDRWFLEIIYTVNDPEYYSRPWSFVRTYAWRPDFGLPSEYNCEEQLGDRNNTNSTAGFVPEPE